MQRKLFLARADMNTIDHCSRHSTCCQSKISLFKIATLVFCLFFLSFYGTLPPYLSLCLSVYTPSCTLRSGSDGKIKYKKTLSCARWKLEGFGYWSFSVQASFVWNNLPAHIRHCSSLSQFKTSLKKHFSVLQPTLSYSKPFTSIGCCTFFDLGFAADVFTG